MDQQKLDEADAMIPHIDIERNCNNCAGSEKFKAQYQNERNAFKTEVYLARKMPDSAFPLLTAVTEYYDSTRNLTFGNLLHKYWYLYYQLKGETAKALEKLERFKGNEDRQNRFSDSMKRSEGKKQFALVRSYESQLLRDQAEKEKLLQQQQLMAVERQAQIDMLEAEAKNIELQANATNTALQSKITTERIQAEAKKNELQQQFRITSLDKDLNAQRQTRALLLSGLGLFVIFAGVLFALNRQKKKANSLLQLQKQEISTQRDQLEKTLKDLKETQLQLIQKEKMASLGELTAGIAHEIQNPLNFVNNFSDVNKELALELTQELQHGNVDDAIEIANDIITNSEKINHHGKRADAIVKNMLQHSRTAGGARELKNINALADEYLRLAYHGLRAKDKSFNAALVTNFEESIGNVSIVAQDISRVLLNLYNNAFYAVAEKKKLNADFSPEVSVTTRKINDAVEITVKDNGDGIPEAIVNKIFQPFFTTKPTGQGTGLGLSLSYDIVKAQGGELRLKTKEGEGCEFILSLPKV
jgi:signal transduction histidine kinase